MSNNHTQKLIDKFVQDKKYRDNLYYIELIDSFLLYDDVEKYHKLLPERQVEKEIYHYFKYEGGKNISQSLVRDMRWQISMSCYNEIEDVPKDYIAFEDRLLNLSSLCFEEFDKEKITYHKIPFKSENLSMETPVFNKFLDSICVDAKLQPDEEMKTVLQEMFGYYIFGKELTGEAYFMLGEGSNGKSVIIDLLVEIIGKEFTSAMSIQNLTTDKWKMIELIGKKLNVCGEEQSKYMQLGVFKDILTGGLVDCQRKYGGSFKFRPNAKFLFGTNRLPTLDQIGKHIKRRFKIVKFHRIIEEKDQDRQLLTKLKNELAGIIGWAMIGKRRLVENNGVFSYSKNMEDAYNEFEENASSPVMFFREQYEESEGSFVSNSELYEHYKQWCIDNGRKSMSKHNFGKDLSHVCTLPSKVGYSKEILKTTRGRQLKPKTYEEPNIQGLGERNEEGSGDVVNVEF